MYKSINFEEKSYHIIKTLPIHSCLNKDDSDVDVFKIELWKDFLGCENVFTDNNNFLFIKEIEELNFEEI